MDPALLWWVQVAALAVAIGNFLLNGNFGRIAGLWKWAAPRRPEVVIGVVVREGKALLVERKPNEKSKLRWQFPAGQLTDSYPDLASRLKSEILAETGV